MTEKTEFSFDISVDPASGFKPLPDLVAFDLCRAYPVPGGNLLLQNTRTGKRAVVMPDVYASLLTCNQFQTLDEHATRIVENNPDMQGQQENIRQVLQSMLDQGIMLSARTISNNLKNSVENPVDEGKAGAPVATIITWERPQALERLLESVVSNCDTGRLHCLYVIDDSRDADNIRQNQVLVEKFASQLKTPLQYFGQDEQQSLLHGLVEKLPEHEGAIRFLADQSIWRDFWTSGLSRNLALLLSCGRRLVMIDDDTICDVYDPPQAKPNITFSDEPREADFFNSEKDWASRRQPLNPDPINRHMQCLGLSFSEALTVLGQNHFKAAGFKNATTLEISELHQGSRVLVTECGSLGCPGTDRNTWLPDMASKSLRKMLASAEKTTNSLTRRKVWSGRNQPHFSPRTNMSQITGFDNREMLPPYFPIERGEDRLFGYMLDFIFPTSVTLDYPWSIPHLPLPAREWRNKDLNFTPADSFPMFFVARVLGYKSACLSSSPTDRLTALSAWFYDLAAANNNSLIQMHHDARLRSSSEQLQHLGALLSEAESAPVDWQNYLRNGIEQLNSDLGRVSHEPPPVKGFPPTLEGEELIAFWKDTWSGFAASLNAWPDIRAAAADIIETGPA